jgi:hypothetical protein
VLAALVEQAVPAAWAVLAALVERAVPAAWVGLVGQVVLGVPAGPASARPADSAAHLAI